MAALFDSVGSESKEAQQASSKAWWSFERGSGLLLKGFGVDLRQV